jgi:hypothetical protein
MGLFNNFMPGESYGIPDQSQGGVQGLLSNPLLNIGLGILANNNSRNLGQVLGRGALSGLKNVQQQQQLEQQRKMQDAQAQEYERRQKEFDREQKAIEDFKVRFPEYAGAIDLDPKAAIKAAYPNVAANAVDPYFTPIPTEQGLGRFNARTGQFELLTDPAGKPIIKSTDSPLIRGAVRQAEAGGTAAYNIDTSIPGVVSTAKQVAEQANPSLVQPQQPIPQIPQGTPMLPKGAPQAATPQAMRVPAPVQRQRDDLRMKILLDEQRNEGGPGVNPELDKEIARMGGGQVLPTGGIKVPTPAEQAALTTTATEQAKTNVGLATEKTKNVKKADQFLSVARQAETLLNDKSNKPTASGIGAAVDAAGNIIGVAADGSVPAAKLEALSGWLVSNVPRMEGPQSNFDVQNYQTMSGLIGDRTKPLEIRQGALKEVIRLQEKYKELNQDGAIMPKDETMPAVKALALPAKPSALTLKKGQVYSTPKGNLRWNGKAFED